MKLSKNLLAYSITVTLAATTVAWAGGDKDNEKNKHPSGETSSKTTSESTGASDDQESATSSSSAKSHQLVRLSDLMEAKIKSSDDESLGTLEDLLVNPTTGKIDFAILGRGGFLGIGEKLVPVPWQAISVQSEKSFTVNVDKEKLRSAPTLDREYSNIHDPGYTVTIYRFFAVPADVGGSEPDDSSTTVPDSDTSSQSETNQYHSGTNLNQGGSDQFDPDKIQGGEQFDTNSPTLYERPRGSSSTRPTHGPTSLRL